MTAVPPPVERRVNIIQGEYKVVIDPTVVLTTILGSCVGACICDPRAAIGGMNHFLLPGDSREKDCGGHSLRYGVQSMELLINGLLREGAQRSRLEAKLFGGARMMRGLTDIGEQNARFAERFLRDEGISVVGGSLRGDRGRRIQFWPTAGRARQIFLVQGDDPIRVAPPPALQNSGTLELF